MIPIEVIYAKQTLGAGDSGYGLLLASWGVGMVLGSIVFAAVRRASLPVLLFFSTIAVGAGYLGLAAAPTLALACAASVVGGAGNGVQWVSVISAVQELTVAGHAGAGDERARVDRRGDARGRLPARRPDRHRRQPASDLPRRRARASCAIVAIAAPLLGTKWPETQGKRGPEALTPSDEIMVELIPVRERPPARSELGGRELRKLGLRRCWCSDSRAARALGLAACGSSSSGKEGGTLNGSYASFPDYLDPQLSYTAEGWTAMYDTYIPLLTYAHADGTAGSEVVPGLAEEPAQDHQRRQDLHAEPAQGPQVLRRHAGQGLRLQRLGRTAASSSTRGGSPFYTGIVGAEKFAETRAAASPGSRPTTRPARSSST